MSLNGFERITDVPVLTAIINSKIFNTSAIGSTIVLGLASALDFLNGALPVFAILAGIITTCILGACHAKTLKLLNLQIENEILDQEQKKLQLEKLELIPGEVEPKPNSNGLHVGE